MQGCIAQWGAVFVQPEGRSTSQGLRVYSLFYVPQWPSSLVSMSLRVCPLVLGEAAEKLLKPFPFVPDKLIGAWQAAGALTAHAAEQLLKILNVSYHSSDFT